MQTRLLFSVALNRNKMRMIFLKILSKMILVKLFMQYILNKSENATPILFAIYIQNYESQECNRKCILMYKYWVMHNSKSFTDVVTKKHMKAI